MHINSNRNNGGGASSSVSLHIQLGTEFRRLPTAKFKMILGPFLLFEKSGPLNQHQIFRKRHHFKVETWGYTAHVLMAF